MLEVKVSWRLLSIGELARRAGVATSALRYWDELGLHPAPARISDQWHYPESAVALVGVILLLSDIGFTLAEQKAVALDEWRRLARRKVPRTPKSGSLQLPSREPRRCVFTPEFFKTKLGGDKNIVGRRLDAESPSEQDPRRTNDGHCQRALHSP